MIPILLSFFLASSSPDHATYFISNEAALELPIATSSMDAIERFDASFWHVPYRQVDDIITCESGHQQYARGDHDTSFGLVQIHDLGDKGITLAEAFSPLFSINYLAQHIAEGRANMWSCNRITGWEA